MIRPTPYEPYLPWLGHIKVKSVHRLLNGGIRVGPSWIKFSLVLFAENVLNGMSNPDTGHSLEA